MKIYQLLDFEPRIPLSNEEHKFVESHHNEIHVDQLQERELVVAHNLVRKGVYAISKDNERLIKRGHEINKKTVI
jgi:hypothetical protein